MRLRRTRADERTRRQRALRLDHHARARRTGGRRTAHRERAWHGNDGVRRGEADERMGVTSRPIRVLCVDDHRLMREGVAKMISVQPDMKVVAEASNGDHAVTQFLATRPDVTLMDLQLPVTSGSEAIHRIRELDPSARIIVLTMYRGDEDIHRAFKAGAMGYVLKDTICDDLIHVIREVHAGRPVVTNEIQQALDEWARLPALSLRRPSLWSRAPRARGPPLRHRRCRRPRVPRNSVPRSGSSTSLCGAR